MNNKIRIAILLATVLMTAATFEKQVDPNGSYVKTSEPLPNLEPYISDRLKELR